MGSALDSVGIGRLAGHGRHGVAGVMALVLCSFRPAPLARAQNLLPNAGFNADISGWIQVVSGDISVSWNSLDAKESSGSGSLRMTNTSPVDNAGYNYFGFCVPVAAGQSYHTGASYFFPGGQARDAGFEAFAWFYSSPDCSGTFLSQTYAVLTPAAVDTWQRLDTQPVAAPAGAVAAFAGFGFRKFGNGGSVIGNLDDAVFELSGSKLCFWSDDLLCLGGRFRVTAHWTSSSGSGDGHAVALVSDTGSFWFFSPSNLEMLVKVLDACGLNGKKWVFGGGLTNVNVVITITDLQTSAQKTYTNPLNTAFLPVQDTSAFGTCP
jgi:hypothetical protein